MRGGGDNDQVVLVDATEEDWFGTSSTPTQFCKAMLLELLHKVVVVLLTEGELGGSSFKRVGVVIGISCSGGGIATKGPLMMLLATCCGAWQEEGPSSSTAEVLPGRARRGGGTEGALLLLDVFKLVALSVQ